mmetsp:Transcript_104641/g.272364  ORF Transcript_104641/g.272364 Transcript_104641/m.272364 type:complete len:235 (-) Transcript_104641:597-1301(-)
MELPIAAIPEMRPTSCCISTALCCGSLALSFGSRPWSSPNDAANPSQLVSAACIETLSFCWRSSAPTLFKAVPIVPDNTLSEVETELQVVKALLMELRAICSLCGFTTNANVVRLAWNALAKREASPLVRYSCSVLMETVNLWTCVAKAVSCSLRPSANFDSTPAERPLAASATWPTAPDTASFRPLMLGQAASRPTASLACCCSSCCCNICVSYISLTFTSEGWDRCCNNPWL